MEDTQPMPRDHRPIEGVEIVIGGPVVVTFGAGYLEGEQATANAKTINPVSVTILIQIPSPADLAAKSAKPEVAEVIYFDVDSLVYASDAIPKAGDSVLVLVKYPKRRVETGVYFSKTL